MEHRASASDRGAAEREIGVLTPPVGTTNIMDGMQRTNRDSGTFSRVLKTPTWSANTPRAVILAP
jgi:hypothetical protein